MTRQGRLARPARLASVAAARRGSRVTSDPPHTDTPRAARLELTRSDLRPTLTPHRDPCRSGMLLHYTMKINPLDNLVVSQFTRLQESGSDQLPRRWISSGRGYIQCRYPAFMHLYKYSSRIISVFGLV